MKRSYFEMEDDVSMDGRWFLNGLSDRNGVEFDSREFTYGLRIPEGPPLRLGLANEDRVAPAVPPLLVSLRRKGIALDITFADFDMPVVTQRVASILQNVAGMDIQRFPVRVESQQTPFEIINVVSIVDCIDKEKSEIEWWSEGNDIRPDLAGTPEMVTKLIIDPARVASEQIYRIRGWEGPIIVSSLVKRALEEATVSGVTFQRV